MKGRGKSFLSNIAKVGTPQSPLTIVLDVPSELPVCNIDRTGFQGVKRRYTFPFYFQTVPPAPVMPRCLPEKVGGANTEIPAAPFPTLYSPAFMYRS